MAVGTGVSREMLSDPPAEWGVAGGRGRLRMGEVDVGVDVVDDLK